MRLRVDDCYDRTVSGDLDLGCVPPSEVQNTAATYGVRRTKPVGTGRFWVKPTDCAFLVYVNQRRDLFRGNPSLRKALNWAVDRTAFAAQHPPHRRDTLDAPPAARHPGLHLGSSPAAVLGDIEPCE